MDKDTGEFQENPKIKFGVGALLFVGLFIFSIGVGFFYFGSQKSSDEVKIISPDVEESVSEIVVHVDGAVANPGVYHLKTEARISDAVSAAGGLGENADSSRVNLAAKVSDGQKILIPTKGESVTASIAGSSTGPVNINTASSSQLDSLPGVGSVTSGKIISARPYSTVDELMSKKVVSKSVFEKIKDLVSVY